MRVWVPAALFALFLAGLAHADGIGDGTAGLEALNRGDYDTAIRLFTRALEPGRLSREDSEFALLNRGNAYAAKGEYPLAIADLNKAVAIKPDDADARKSLQAVLSKQAGEQAPRPAIAAAERSGDPWGLLSTMAGRYYWYQALGADPHAAFVHLNWVAPQQALSLSVRNKTDQMVIREYKLDGRTGKIIFSELVADKPQYGTVDSAGGGLIEYGYASGSPVRVLTRLQAGGSIVQTRQVYVNSSWRDTTSVTLVETDLEGLAAQGLVKAKKH